MWVDSDSGIGARVVVAGSTGCVAAAKLVVETLITSFMNKAESGASEWTLTSPFYPSLDYSLPSAFEPQPQQMVAPLRSRWRSWSTSPSRCPCS